jgi:transcriptional regulator GlxA family with amidase domain
MAGFEGSLSLRTDRSGVILRGVTSEALLETRSVALVAFPDAQILDVTGPLEVFSVASRVLEALGRPAEAPAYRLALLAREAGPVRMSNGLALLATASWREAADEVPDTLLVAGGIGSRAAAGDRELLGWLCRMAGRVRRIGSVCTGSSLLAEAGLLDGRRATTHWAYARELADRHPAIRVEPDPIFVRDGNVYTSAGVTAGMDLALALVEEDHGRELALEVARRLVLFLKRPGGQSQFSAQLSAQLAERDAVREVQAWILEHPDEDCSVSALAFRAAMSPRNFARVFAREVDTTPARFVESARVEAARRLLEDTQQGVDAVATACGFGSAETMRRAFLRTLRVSPADYRSRFRDATPREAPSRRGAHLLPTPERRELRH